MKVKRKTKKEIALLRDSGKILMESLLLVKEEISQATKREVSTFDLDQLAEENIRKRGGKPSFLNYSEGGSAPFPASLCVSIGSEIVHGVPSKKVFLSAGDLVKIDLGVCYKGMFTDAALSVIVGRADDVAYRLVEAAEGSLRVGIDQIYPGSFLGNFGSSVEKYIISKKFFVVKGLVGHGVGYAVHEAPQIPNYGKVGTGLKIEEGMVFALEPMVGETTGEIEEASNGFTYLTKDGGLASHVEHTVVVTKNGCEVLTKL